MMKVVAMIKGIIIIIIMMMMMGIVGIIVSRWGSVRKI